MKILLDNNNFRWHFEIVYSIMLFLKKKYKKDITFFLYDSFINHKQRSGRNKFLDRTKEKYQIIKKINNNIFFDLNVSLTTNLSKMNKNDINLFKSRLNNDKYLFIFHRCYEIFYNFRNILTLTNLCRDYTNNWIIPYNFPYKKSSIKENIFLVQGSFLRRDKNIIINILNYSKASYKIKILTLHHVPNIIKNNKNVEIISITNDDLYHLEVQKCKYIIPCISPKENNNYYTIQPTSSIAYAKGFGLKIFGCKELCKAYDLTEKDGFFYENNYDMIDVFDRMCN